MAVKVTIGTLRLAEGPVNVEGDILRRQWQDFQNCVYSGMSINMIFLGFVRFWIKADRVSQKWLIPLFFGTQCQEV